LDDSPSRKQFVSHEKLSRTTSRSEKTKNSLHKREPSDQYSETTKFQKSRENLKISREVIGKSTTETRTPRQSKTTGKTPKTAKKSTVKSLGDSTDLITDNGNNSGGLEEVLILPLTILFDNLVKKHNIMRASSTYSSESSTTC